MEVPVAQDFRELRVWQDAMALAEAVYAATRLFPPEERLGLQASCVEPRFPRLHALQKVMLAIPRVTI
jgi:hypothetical protein